MRTGLIVSAVFAAAMPAAAQAKELKWRSGRSALRATSTAATARGADSAVLPAKFDEDDGELQLGSPSDAAAQFRSVVTQRDSEFNGVRSAQLPPTGTPDSPLDQPSQIPGEPAADPLPPLDVPDPEGLDFDMPPQPQDDALPFGQDQPPPAELQQVRPESLDVLPGQPLPESVPMPSIGTMEAERKKAEQACEQGFSDLEAKTIDTLSLSIAVTGAEGTDYPFECALDANRWHEGRCWEDTTYLWKASALCHKPLFFEDEHLERYGHSWAPVCQPLVSGAHFFTRLPILPYCMGVEPPNECVYALGHYRPGSCAPYMCNPVPLSFRGALFQAGATVGTAAFLP